jgi:hypothetical protein
MHSNDRYRSNRVSRAIFGAALALLMPLVPGLAAAQVCPKAITKCGCTITNSAIYTLSNDVFATASGDCIDIAKDHAILNLKGHQVIGRSSGTDIGIHILNGADHVIVEGGDEATNDPPQDPAANDISGGQGGISQWNIGILDDADDAVIELFSVIGGGMQLSQGSGGNTTAGVYLNRVHNTIIGSFLAAGNGKFGVVVDHCTNIQIDNVGANGNGEAGIWMTGSSDSRFGPASITANQDLGVWIDTSNKNVVYDVASSGNSNIGIVLGCGAHQDNCSGSHQSNTNLVTNTTVSANKMGTVIGKQSGNNVVTINQNAGNGDNVDLVDDNNKCGSNVWYNNTGSGNQDCIE